MALAGAPLFAQGFDDATAAGLAKLGIQAPPVEAMSVEQQAEIQNVIASSDTDDNKRRQIELILGEEATATGRLGVGQLQSSVGADLAQLGIDASGVDSLTLSQLAQIENVMAGGDIGRRQEDAGRGDHRRRGDGHRPARRRAASGLGRRPTSRSSASTPTASRASACRSSGRSRTSSARARPTRTSGRRSRRSSGNRRPRTAWAGALRRPGEAAAPGGTPQRNGRDLTLPAPPSARSPAPRCPARPR